MLKESKSGDLVSLLPVHNDLDNCSIHDTVCNHSTRCLGGLYPNICIKIAPSLDFREVLGNIFTFLGI